jgi:hypothetical protein
MRISLTFLPVVRALANRLEPFRIAIFSVISALFAAQVYFQVLLKHFVSTNLWACSAVQAIALTWLTFQFRKRGSLRWRAERLQQTLREPPDLFVSKWIRGILDVKEFGSLILWWAALDFLIWPFYEHSSGLKSIGYLGTVFAMADKDFFADLWEVHATVLGVFLVLLTFVFQFISLRSAYETNLLPFLAKRARLAPIITINFIFVALEMFVVALGNESISHPALRYLAVVGFAFAVLSGCHLLFRVLDLLNPEMIEVGLSELVRKDLIIEFEEEQLLALAGSLLAEECSCHEMEFSEIDIFENLPPIRSLSTGRVIDVDIRSLGKFSKRLTTPLPSSTPPQKKAFILRMIGDELTDVHNVLGRVSRADLNSRTERLLRKSFKVEEI